MPMTTLNVGRPTLPPVPPPPPPPVPPVPPTTPFVRGNPTSGIVVLGVPITIPSAQVGDRLVVVVAGTLTLPTTPAGWTREAIVSGPLGVYQLAAYTRQATGSDSFAFPLAITGVYHAYAVANATTTDAKATTQTNAAAQVTKTATAVTVWGFAGNGSSLGAPLVGTLLAEVLTLGLRLLTATQETTAAGQTPAVSAANATATLTLVVK